MVALELVAILTKVVKLLLNIVVVALYRWGDEGYILGATYNKNHDAEALTAGVVVGFLIYNCVALVSTCFDKSSIAHSITEVLMNLAGFALWLIAGVVALQFWNRYEPDLHYRDVNPRKAGIAMGSLAVICAPVYAVEAVANFIIFRNQS